MKRRSHLSQHSVEELPKGPWTFLVAIVNAFTRLTETFLIKGKRTRKSLIIYACSCLIILVLATIVICAFGGFFSRGVPDVVQSQISKRNMIASGVARHPSPPTSFFERQAVEKTYNDAVTLMREGRHADAAFKFSEFLRGSAESTSSAMGLYNLAVCYQNLAEKESGTGVLEAANETFKIFLAKYPEHKNVPMARENLEKTNVLLLERAPKP